MIHPQHFLLKVKNLLMNHSLHWIMNRQIHLRCEMDAFRCYVLPGNAWNTNMKLNVPLIPRGIPSKKLPWSMGWTINTAIAAIRGAEFPWTTHLTSYTTNKMKLTENHKLMKIITKLLQLHENPKATCTIWVRKEDLWTAKSS